MRIFTKLTLVTLGLALVDTKATEPDGLQLPDRSITVRGGIHSSFNDFKSRSRAVLNFKTKVKKRNPNVAVVFVDETVVPGAQIWMYPDGSGYPLPSMTDAHAKEGKFSFEVSLKADVYSGGAICSPSPLDLAKYQETGMLEFWVKGAEGSEIFSIGLLDNGNNPVGRPLQVFVNSRSFSKVLKDDWRRIRIPLKAFGGRGSYWSEELNARISNSLNWSGISCFSFDIDKERFKTFKVWFDGVTVFKKMPKGSQSSGLGYNFANEDFEDFPKGDGK